MARTLSGECQSVVLEAPDDGMQYFKTWGSHQSVLAEVVLSGHRDKDGQPRIRIDEAGRRRILAWIDLNVPYYGSSETAYPEMTGCRRIYPQKLDQVLSEVAARRCGECHKEGKIPRREWTRITEPGLNPFLVAPFGQVGQRERALRPGRLPGQGRSRLPGHPGRV